MERKLLLSSLGFPDKFLSSSISPPNTAPKQQYMEQKIIEAINRYNPKLKVSGIEYLDIKDQFPYLKIGKYAGVIVEDIAIEQLQKDLYIEKQYFVWESGGEWYARKIVIYIFLSDYEVKGRNIISQSIFPELIDFMGLYNSSPSFSIANYPIYYINFLSNKITASTIIKQIAGMVASNIEYVEVFEENTELRNVPKSIKEYLTKFERDFVAGNTIYSSDYFEIDMNNEITKIKTDKLVLGDYLILKNGTGPEYQFKGSSEKFYWMEIMPIIILSWENGYTIDYTLLEDFYNQNSSRFSENDDKFHRFSLLIQFIKKIMLRGEE